MLNLFYPLLFGEIMSLMNVEDVKYNINTAVLTVKYGGGSVWEYFPVKTKEFEEIRNSSCKSHAVHTLTRRGDLVGTKKEVQ